MLDMLTLIKNIRATKILIKHSMMTSQIKTLIKNTKPFLINMDNSDAPSVGSESSSDSDKQEKFHQ